MKAFALTLAALTATSTMMEYSLAVSIQMDGTEDAAWAGGTHYDQYLVNMGWGLDTAPVDDVYILNSPSYLYVGYKRDVALPDYRMRNLEIRDNAAQNSPDGTKFATWTYWYDGGNVLNTDWAWGHVAGGDIQDGLTHLEGLTGTQSGGIWYPQAQAAPPYVWSEIQIPLSYLNMNHAVGDTLWLNGFNGNPANGNQLPADNWPWVGAMWQRGSYVIANAGPTFVDDPPGGGAVPEPASIILLASACAAGLPLYRRLRKERPA